MWWRGLTICNQKESLGKPQKRCHRQGKNTSLRDQNGTLGQKWLLNTDQKAQKLERYSDINAWVMARRDLNKKVKF